MMLDATHLLVGLFYCLELCLQQRERVEDTLACERSRVCDQGRLLSRLALKRVASEGEVLLVLRYDL